LVPPVSLDSEEVMFTRRAIVLALLAGAALLLPGDCGAQAFSYSSIVQAGDPSPDGGKFFACTLCQGRVNGSRAFNVRGEVGMAADTLSSCFIGRFLASTTERVLLANNCIDTPLGKLNLLGDVNLNDNGDAIVVAGPLDAQGRLKTGILLYSNGRLTKVAEEGDQTPSGLIGGCQIPILEPFINNCGQIVFQSCTTDNKGTLHEGAFTYSGGQVALLVGDGDPSPSGGFFAFNFVPRADAINNNAGDILFQAGDIPPNHDPEEFGLFLRTADGTRKIATTGDVMPNGKVIPQNAFPRGTLNGNGDVAFLTNLSDDASARGVFLWSAGLIKTIVLQGDLSPIGGQFSSLTDVDLTLDFGPARPQLNAKGEVVFKAKAGRDGKTIGLFMASPAAIVKIVAVGDVLPSGDQIGEIDTYSLNENGEVAFFAYKQPGEKKALGVYKASPVAPSIRSVRLKHRATGVQLKVTGAGFIINDAVVEIDGQQLGAITYPSADAAGGGTTKKLLSDDPALAQLPAGKAVSVTVFNPLTGLRSGAFQLTAH
jgi:hypothetical protein